MAKPWFKVWTDKWLDGSTRRELTRSQRATWVDLLALCARYNVDGRQMKRSGIIPLTAHSIAYTLHEPERYIQSVLDRLVEVGKVALSEDGVTVTNWERYNPSRNDVRRYGTHGYTVVHESTESESESESENPPPPQPEVYKVYEGVFGLITPTFAESLEYWRQELGDETVIEALKEGQRNKARDWRYCDKILRGWRDHGKPEEPKAPPKVYA